MFAYRQRGLVTLHGAAVCGFITALLPLYAQLVPLLPRVQLSDEIELLPYTVAVFLAMMASAGSIRRQGASLIILGWAGAFALAARQIMVVAAALFAVVFTLKDSGISRLFLVTYFVIAFLLLTYLHVRFPTWLARLLFPERTKLPTVFVGSGAGLEDFLRTNFPRVEAVILDFYHAAEHLCAWAKAWYGPGAEAEREGAGWCHRLKHEGGAAGLAALRAADVQEPHRQVLVYVENQVHRMDYPTYRAKGWLIGSGPVEAACKQLVNQRLKGSGMRWSESGADAVCHLRALFRSEKGQWGACWATPAA